MLFITLRLDNIGTSLYLNADKIVTLSVHKDCGMIYTCITTVDSKCIEVLETPEEIFKLIEEAKRASEAQKG